MENEKKYSQDGLSMKILDALNDHKPSENLGQSSNFEKDQYGGSSILGINTSILDLGLIKKEPQKSSLKLKGLTAKAERSDLVKEVLETPPSWLIKWGSTWSLVVVLMILAISWFVEYPDMVKGAVQITSNDVAKAINSRKDGILEELFVKEGEVVTKNQRLGRIESIADPDEINKLKIYLVNLQKSLNSGKKSISSSGKLPELNNLGELQEFFQGFSQAYNSKSYFGSSGVESEKLEIINQDLREYEKVDENLQKQLSNYNNDYRLANDEFLNQQKLYKKGLISQNELRLSESKMIAKKQQMDQVVSAFNSNQIQKNQKQQEILSVKKGEQDQNANFKLEVNRLLSAIENWEKEHYLTASSDGKLIFLKNIQVNQQVRNGENLFYVMPTNANSTYGEMFVGQYNIGKIKVGQRVILKFDGYPYQEFGTIDAKIATISDIPIDSVYRIKVVLPKNELLKNNKNVKIKVGMTASGEIVTEELRLIEKLFYEIRKYVKR